MICKNNFFPTALILLIIMGLGGYYLYVLGLNRNRNVSEAFSYYYLKKELRFWNKYQTMYVIPGHVYDTTRRPPFFLDRQGFDYPKFDGSGMVFKDNSNLHFRLYKKPQELYVYFRLKAEMGQTRINVGSESVAYLDNPGSYEVFLPIVSSELRMDSNGVYEVNIGTSLPVSIYAMAITSEPETLIDDDINTMQKGTESHMVIRKADEYSQAVCCQCMTSYNN